MLMLTSRRALAQQNLDQNTLSRTLGTLGGGVGCELCEEMHRPGPCPQVTLHTEFTPAKHAPTRTRTRTHTHTQKQVTFMHICAYWIYTLTTSTRMCYAPGLLPGVLRLLTVETFLRGISLCTSSVRVHHVRLVS